MTWTVDTRRREAMNEHGYRITWAENSHGTWFNGWAPNGKHLEANYNREVVKAACETHRMKRSVAA